MLNSDTYLNHIFLLSLDFLLLFILLVLLVFKISLRNLLSYGITKLSISSTIFNGCLSLGYIVFGVWKLKEQHQEYELVVHGITWLFVSLFISLRKKQTFLIVKIYSIIAFLLAVFLCITSMWKFKYDHGNVTDLLNGLSFIGAILLLCIGFIKGSECDETCYKPLQDGITPFANAGFLGNLSFWWLNPLMKKGKNKTLEDEDVPRLRSADEAGTCFDQFNEKVDMLKRKDPLGKLSILMAILLCHKKSILISGVFALIKVLTLTTGPLFLHTFIKVAEGRESFKYEGFALTAGFFLAKCLESLAERQWLFRSRLIGLQVKSSLTAAIFHKQLHVLNAAKKTHSPGQIMNYVTVDAHKIGEFPFWFHQIWTTFLQLVLVLCVMYYSIGVAASAALVIVIVTVVANSPLSKLQLKYQTNLMIAQDKRLKAITEALAHMKVLKLYSWEKHFMDAISKLRSEETKWLSFVQTQKGYYLVLFWSSPILVSSATFVACYLFGVPLHVSNVFTFLASINLVQQPIRNLPDVVGAFIEAKVSLSRIVKFLEEPDMHTRDMKKKRQDDVNICINCTDVSWEMNTLKPTLKDINIDIKHGEKVAVCGEVGSGKSTLLSLILGEVPYINGTVDVYGKIAYVSQTAWIQTGTIQENILFGSNMEPQRYRQAIERSSLVKDLEMLPFGDLTEIGERGNNLSGGQKQRIQLARALYQDADIYLLDDPFSAVDAHTSTNLFNDYVMGALSGKTVLLVTHQVEFLPAFDSILVSSDLSIVDIELPFLLNYTVGSIIISYSTYVILCFFAPEVLLIIVLMIYVTILVQRYYNASAKELMRLNGTTKSLVANHLAESISGIMTIRAFGQEGRFFLKNLEFIDKNARPIFHTFSATEWLILRLEIICTIIMSSWMLGMTSLHSGSSGLTGMAFSYGLSLNAILVWCVQCQCTLENSIISVERLEQYMRIPSEESELVQTNHPLPGWPTCGKVEIRDLKVRYRPNAPLVLQGISCTFEGGQKIGVVGRTGSGKTTLISALFRLVEPTDGKIIIDECDISTIRLHDLRSRIGIIPQDATLFTGSVRYNLDPLSKYSDDQIWNVLDKCQLREAVQEKEGGLDSSVVQDGSNWSMGQRQLFCLGRALLKRSRILVLDEATASIDNATDAILQKTIRLEFADCTVITVAHRIPTVMDYTKVLAISDGKLVEFDEPKKLINKEGSLFRMLVKEYWARVEK